MGFDVRDFIFFFFSPAPKRNIYVHIYICTWIPGTFLKSRESKWINFVLEFIGIRNS